MKLNQKQMDALLSIFEHEQTHLGGVAPPVSLDFGGKYTEINRLSPIWARLLQLQEWSLH